MTGGQPIDTSFESVSLLTMHHYRPERRPSRSTGRPLSARFVLTLCTAVGAVGWAAAVPSRAATPEQVDVAIKKGVAWLWLKQKADGRWEQDFQRKGDGHDWGSHQGDTWGGYSALATYALLSAGEKHQDPRMVQAINFLKRADIVGTYGIATSCQVWYLLTPTPENLGRMHADAARLAAGLGREGAGTGMWVYVCDPAHGLMEQRRDKWGDHSVSQFGVLGMWACAEGGVSIAPNLWKMMDTSWRVHQNPDGGWAYTGTGQDGQPSDLAMTAAGVATLFITRDMMGPPAGSLCRGNLSDPAIDRGLAWIAQNWKTVDEAYTLYGLERIGAASGLQQFGRVDWYTAGADVLVKKQKPDGSWEMTGTGASPLSDTAFALLFLSHGRAPVLINKLNYSVNDLPPLVTPPVATQPGQPVQPGVAAAQPGGQPAGQPAPPTRQEPVLPPGQGGSGTAPGLLGGRGAAPTTPPITVPPVAPVTPLPPAGQTTPATQPARDPADRPWNQRPRDIANLVQFMRPTLETFLNWQVVSAGASADDLNTAPILYISGNKPLSLTADEEDRLKLYVLRGGMIFANNDCPGTAGGTDDPFSRSVIDLGQKLWREPGYRFRQLTATHPIFNDELYKSARWQELPVLLGLGNGVREFIVLCPGFDPGKSWQKGAPKTDATAFELGVDMCLYAAGKQNLYYKGQTWLVKPVGVPSRTVRVARLHVGENWDPEPAGWWRLDAILRNGFAVGLSTEPVVPTDGKLNGFTVAHLTGTTPFTLPPEQRREIMRFVAAGGTLIVDAAGGSRDFADAAEKELATMFGGRAGDVGELLDLTDPLYTHPKAKIATIEYREYMRQRTAGRLNAPRVRGIKVPAPGGAGMRTGVYYSAEDLSAGLVGQPVDGIMGYTPDRATAIVRNMILLAAGVR